MALKLKEYFVFTCDECSRPFPKSTLVNLDASGALEDFKGRYCINCYHKVIEQIESCSECGDEYPKEHLYKSLTDRKTILCLRCLNKEEEDEI